METLVAQLHSTTITAPGTATAIPQVTADCTVLATMPGTSCFDDDAGTATAATTDMPDWIKYGWTWEVCDKWKAEQWKLQEEQWKLQEDAKKDKKWTEEEWRQWLEWQPSDAGTTDSQWAKKDSRWAERGVEWKAQHQSTAAWPPQDDADAKKAKAPVPESTAPDVQQQGQKRPTKSTDWSWWSDEDKAKWEHKVDRDLDKKRTRTDGPQPAQVAQTVQNPLSTLPASKLQQK